MHFPVTYDLRFGLWSIPLPMRFDDTKQPSSNQHYFLVTFNTAIKIYPSFECCMFFISTVNVGYLNVNISIRPTNQPFQTYSAPRLEHYIKQTVQTLQLFQMFVKDIIMLLFIFLKR